MMVDVAGMSRTLAPATRDSELRIRKQDDLTRIIHDAFTAAAYLCMSAALHSLELLDVP